MQSGNNNKDAKELDYNEVPAGWQICFNGECPQREDCLRWVAARKLPLTVKWGPAVYPTALEEDGQCSFFYRAEPRQMAWGFSKLFYNVLNRHAVSLRKNLKDYLNGHANYYRYNRGDKLLSPEQQTHILDMFRKLGYEKDLAFDGYVTAYDFSHCRQK